MMKEFAIGEKVRVIALPSYLKTADPRPMLRPSNTIQVGEEGVVIDRNPGNYWSIRFARGTFLMESQSVESLGAVAE